MKAYLCTICLCIFCIYACNTSSDKQKLPDSTTRKAKVNLKDADNGCIFDTSAYRFTTEKLFAFKKDIRFAWDDKKKQATVVFENNDTLILHIGGCDHFSYVATYSTDQAKFNDGYYLLDKTKWLATHFIGGGFDKDITTAITKEAYTVESRRPGIKSLDLSDPKDTTGVSNRILEPVLFRQEHGRTTIDISCYEN